MGIDDDLLFEIHRTRRTDADRVNVLELEARFFDRFPPCLTDSTDSFFRSLIGMSGQIGPAERFALAVNDARLDVGPAKVDSQKVGGVGLLSHQSFIPLGADQPDRD
jgi:hypothetical protein